jgi:hypothetical protein
MISDILFSVSAPAPSSPSYTKFWTGDFLVAVFLTGYCFLIVYFAAVLDFFYNIALCYFGFLATFFT